MMMFDAPHVMVAEKVCGMVQLAVRAGGQVLRSEIKKKRIKGTNPDSPQMNLKKI
jgi:hypothetical protein